MHLNHPETISQPQSVEKLPSTKLVPDARKVGEPLHRGQLEMQSMCITAENPVGEPWSRTWCFISDLSFQCHALPSPQYHGLHFPTEILGLGWEYRDFLFKLLLSSCLCSSICSIASLWPPIPAHGWDSGASQGSVAIHNPFTPSTRCSPGPGQWMWLRIIKDGWSGPERQLEPQASVFSRASCCLGAGPSGEECPCWGVWWGPLPS